MCLRCVVIGITIIETYFTMLKIIEEFDKRLICMGNDVWMWEIA